MGEPITHVSWEAYEHAHGEKGADWFWVLGMVTIALAVAAILLGNTLFGVLILLAGFVLSLSAARPARIVPYEITTRGVRVDAMLYPYSSLEAFFIDEEHVEGPQLLVRSSRMFMSLLTIPLPEEYIDEVEAIVASRLPEEFMEEPIIHKVLGFFGV